MNITGLLNAFDDLPAWKAFVAEIEKKRPLPPLHLPRSARPPVLAELFRTCRVPVVFIAGRIDNVGKWQQSLEAWLPDSETILRFPEPTPLPYERGPWSDRSRLGRIQVLSHLMAGQHPQIPEAERPPLILTSARALLQKSLPKRRFITTTRALRVGQILDLEKMLDDWSGIGYERASVVEAAGQFSQRGGIIDIFPAAAPYPVRIELFGND